MKYLFMTVIFTIMLAGTALAQDTGFDSSVTTYAISAGADYTGYASGYDFGTAIVDTASYHSVDISAIGVIACGAQRGGGGWHSGWAGGHGWSDWHTL